MVSQALRKLKYNDTGFVGDTLSPTYNTNHAFRGNSMYDPDETGVGVQPYGYDQITGLFGVFRVVGSKIRIYFRQENQAAGAIKVCLLATTQTITTTDIADLMQRPGTKAVSVTLADDTRKQKLKSYKSTKWLYPEISPGDAGFNHQLGGNPVYQWYWTIVFDSYDAQVSRLISYDVQITYYAICRQALAPINES